MKKLILAIVIFASSLAFCEQVTGLSTTPKLIEAPTKYGPIKMVSITNTSSVYIYVRKNVTVASFEAATSWPIEPGGTYTTVITGTTNGRDSDIANIVISAASGVDGTADIAFDN